ncbi:MAG: peroxide stress protein YaaA [Solirubrobacterales bacterium]
MLVLLPPSEGKSDPPADADPVDLESLVHPQLTAKRERLMTALSRTANQTEGRALKALGLTKGLAHELERNKDLAGAPAAPAAEVYSGVLYQYLDLASLSAAAHKRAAERTLIASALWGIVRLEDRIPAYRMNMSAKLARIGPLAAYWRPALAKALPPSELLVDMRSGGYAAAWRPAEGTTVNVRAFLETHGKRQVITHMAKATRGEVARVLIKSSTAASSPEELADQAESAGMRVELIAPKKPADPWSLDIIRDTLHSA